MSTALVTIEGVTASQIIGSEPPKPISTGTLSLLNGEGEGGDASSSPLLLLKVDQSVFPLHKNTTMGTHEGKEEWYTFNLDVSGTQTWIRLVLPPLISSEVVSARDELERQLIKHGLLLDGIRATGDEIGRTSTQTGSETAQSIHSASVHHVNTTQPTDSPWTFSRFSRNASRGFKESTETVASYTSAASNAVAGLAASAGSALGSLSAGTREDLGQGDERIMPDTRDAVSDAASGVGHGLSDITSSISTEAPNVTTHNVGQEASHIAGQASQGVGNIAKAGMDVTLGTSSVYHGVEAAKGAVQSQSQDKEDAA